MWRVVAYEHSGYWFIEDPDAERRKVLGLRKARPKKVGVVGARRTNYYDEAIELCKQRNLRDYGKEFDVDEY